LFISEKKFLYGTRKGLKRKYFCTAPAVKKIGAESPVSGALRKAPEMRPKDVEYGKSYVERLSQDFGLGRFS
jgi:hypothetical protein